MVSQVGALAQSARLCHLYPWRFSRHNWIKPWATWTEPIADAAGGWAGDILRSLPNWVIPCFYESKLLLVIIFIIGPTKNGSVLNRAQHKFGIVDSFFDCLLYFLRPTCLLLHFAGILHFSTMRCSSCNNMWQEWHIPLQKLRKGVNFLVDNLKINFICSKLSVLDLFIDYSLKSLAFILSDVVFHSSEKWYLFNRQKIQFIYMIYTVRQVFSSINQCATFEIHGGILVCQKLMGPLHIIFAYLCEVYLGHIQNLI